MLPRDYEPGRLEVVIASIFLGGLFTYLLYINIKTYIAFSGEVRYTIGITKERYITASGRDIRYFYSVNDSIYNSTAGYAYESHVPGGRYWVKYSVKYPEISKIYQNLPVDARIDTIPPNGFKRMLNYQEFLKWRERVEQIKKINH